MSSGSGTTHEPSEEAHDKEETPEGPQKECQSVLTPEQSSNVRRSNGAR